MDSLLAPPLTQISQSSSNIASLHFAPPKIFTNGLQHPAPCPMIFQNEGG